MIKAVIIDDEKLAVTTLQTFLEEYFDDIEVVGTASSLDDAKIVLLKQNPDLVFLDIKLKDGTGFELLDSLSADFRVIFVTAYSEYALEAIKKRAYDYLLKPVDIDELTDALYHVRKELQSSDSFKHATRLAVPCKNGSIYVKINEIMRVEAHGSYSKIFLESGITHMISHNLSYIEKLLNPALFFRCHYSHIVNLSKVEKVIHELGILAVLSDGSQVQVSTRKKVDLTLRMSEMDID